MKTIPLITSLVRRFVAFEEVRSAGLAQLGEAMKLYELPKAFLEVEEVIQSRGGELTPELEATLDKLEATLNEKVDGICGLVANLLGYARAARAEADRLDKLAHTREETATRLKTYLLNTLDALDRNKAETDRFIVWAQNNGRPSIEWKEDLAKLPEEFRRVKIEVDSAKAYDALKAGQELPEGFVVSVGRHLRIH